MEEKPPQKKRLKRKRRKVQPKVTPAVMVSESVVPPNPEPPVDIASETVVTAGPETVTPVAPGAGKLPANLSALKAPGRRWVMVAGGVAALLLGVLFAVLWSWNSRNVLLAFMTIAAWPSGAYLVYRGWRRPDWTKIVMPGGQQAPPKVANSLNIYAYKNADTDEVLPLKVAFEWVEHPKGQPQQCLNNGKWYYVHMWDIAARTLKPFVLPDSQYFDPREFANVIRMPAHRRLFERKATLLQQIGPAVMVVALIVAIFGLIATTPAGGG